MKFMIFIKFLLNWLITHFSNSVKIFHSIIAMKYIEIDLLISSMFIGPCLITLVLIWDAWTRRPGQRTRVRRGGTRGRGRDVTDRASVPRRTASCHVASPESGRRGWNRRRFGGNRRWRGQNRADSVRIGRNGQVRPKFKKKKRKKVQTHRLTNLKTQTPLRPSHFVQHSQTASLTPSLISLLCVLTVLRPSSLFSVFRALCVSAVCCFSLQVCSLCSFLEFLFFVFYNFSLSNCLEKYLWIWKFMCLTTGCLLCFFSCFFNCCGS